MINFTRFFELFFLTFLVDGWFYLHARKEINQRDNSNEKFYSGFNERRENCASAVVKQQQSYEIAFLYHPRIDIMLRHREKAHKKRTQN